LHLTEERYRQIERCEKELNLALDRAALNDRGRASANAVDLKYRTFTEERARESREANRWSWVMHHENQRRAHLEIALEHRARARELRGVA